VAAASDAFIGGIIIGLWWDLQRLVEVIGRWIFTRADATSIWQMRRSKLQHTAATGIADFTIVSVLLGCAY
jgi:hypothetical protein